MVAKLTTTEALSLLLDQVDYTEHACGPTELVAAVLSTDVIATCRLALDHAPPPDLVQTAIGKITEVREALVRFAIIALGGDVRSRMNVMIDMLSEALVVLERPDEDPPAGAATGVGGGG